MRCRSRFGSAFGVILGALALFFRPLRFTRAFQMRSGLHFGTLWTPKSMLPSRREHRFQKISVSAIYLHFGLQIPLKVTSWTPQWRSRRAQSASRALPDALGDAFWPSLGVSWSAPGCPWAVLERSGLSRGYPRACLGPFLEEFGMDLEVRAAKEEGIHSEPS